MCGVSYTLYVETSQTSLESAADPLGAAPAAARA